MHKFIEKTRILSGLPQENKGKACVFVRMHTRMRLHVIVEDVCCLYRSCTFGIVCREFSQKIRSQGARFATQSIVHVSRPSGQARR